MNKRWLGNWSFSKTAFEVIRSLLENGKTILEFGSGSGTQELAKHYTMYSIEHNKKFLNQHSSTYIYAPIVLYDDKYCPCPNIPGHNSELETGWYDHKAIQKNLPEHYDLILIDGPTKKFGRGGFYKHLDLFNTSVPIVLDDINRRSNMILLEKISEHLNRPFETKEEVGVIK